MQKSDFMGAIYGLKITAAAILVLSIPLAVLGLLDSGIFSLKFWTHIDWNKGEIAAAAQAIVTALTFAGAVLFSVQGHRRSIRIFEGERAREEGIRHLRAHSLANALYPDLLEIQQKIKVSDAVISRQRETRDSLTPPKESTKDWKISIPEGLQSSNELFFLLGTNAAPVVSQLLALLHQHNRAAGKIIDELLDEKTFPHAISVFFNRSLFTNRFSIMSEDVDEALELVGKIRDRELLPEYILEAQDAQIGQVEPNNGRTNQ